MSDAYRKMPSPPQIETASAPKGGRPWKFDSKMPLLPGEQRNHVLHVRQDVEYQRVCPKDGDGLVGSNGQLNIVNSYRKGLFFQRDKFRTLLELPEHVVIIFFFIVYILWASLHAIILASITEADHRTALGEHTNSVFDYYFFVVETMFAIGFGSPRSPVSWICNCYVTVIIVSTTILNGVVLGVIFAKFSSNASRRFAVRFSTSLCAAILSSEGVDDYVVPSNAQPAELGEGNIQLGALNSGNSSMGGIPGLTVSLDSSSAIEAIGEEQNASLFAPNGSKDLENGRCLRSESAGSTMQTDRGAPFSPVNASESFTLQVPGNDLRRLSVASSIHSARTGLRTPQTQQEAARMRAFTNMYSGSGGKSAVMSGANFLASRRFSTLTTANGRRPPSPDGGGVRGGDAIGSESSESLKPESYFTLSFRLKNVTHQTFFDAKLSVYLLHHSGDGLVISEFPTFYTDLPLQFMQMPLTVTVDSSHPTSPLFGMSPERLVAEDDLFDVLVLLSFTDNCTGGPVEIRKSWRLNQAVWGAKFSDIVSRLPEKRGAVYEVDVDNIGAVEFLEDHPNQDFRQYLRRSEIYC